MKCVGSVVCVVVVKMDMSEGNEECWVCDCCVVKDVGIVGDSGGFVGDDDDCIEKEDGGDDCLEREERDDECFEREERDERDDGDDRDDRGGRDGGGREVYFLCVYRLCCSFLRASLK